MYRYGLLLLLYLSFTIKATASNPISYDIYFDDNTNKLSIELNFINKKKKNTRLEFPTKWGGALALNKAITIEDLQGGFIADTSDWRAIIISHDKKTSISLKYSVEVEQRADETKNHSDLYRPIRAEDILHFIGATVFVIPQLNEEAEIRLDWHIPQGWNVHNSYGSDERIQKIETVLSEWKNAVFWIGRYHKNSFSVSGNPVYTVFDDANWSFSQAAFNAMLHDVMKYQRDFWNDHDFPYYTVTLTTYPLKEKGYSFMGTGLNNSFSLYASKNAQLDDIMYLLMHELLHEWIGQQIKNGDPEEEYYWFSEGFTDYFTYLLAFESGLATREACLEKMQKKVTDYYTSPVRDVSNSEIFDNFFSKHHTYGRIPYDRGSAFAMYLDHLIRLQSKATLKEPMLDLLHYCKTHDKRMSRKVLTKVLSRYIDNDVDALIQRHMYDGELVPVFSFPGISKKVTNAYTEVFEAGFDHETSFREGIISGVVQSSNAYKEGLRNGQSIHGVSMYYGSIEHDITITILQDDEERQITYRPVRNSDIEIPIFE